MKSTLLFGLGMSLAFILPADLQAQCATSGSTLTQYVGGNGQAGTMFDFTVGAADMTIECIDVNLRTGSGQYDIDVYYCTGTSVGNEQNPAAWTLLASFPGIIPVGTNQATPLDVSGSGMTWTAGQTYGIYVVNNTNYVAGDGPAYTNGGPTTYTGTHCDITTNSGNGTNWGTIFFPREFNGELHTELAGPAGPSLSATGVAGGTMTFDFAGFAGGEQIAIVYGVVGTLSGNAPCGPVTVDLLPLNFPPTTGLIFLTADANGDAQLVQVVPAAGAGLLVQGVGLTGCLTTNTITIL